MQSYGPTLNYTAFPELIWIIDRYLINEEKLRTFEERPRDTAVSVRFFQNGAQVFTRIAVY